jgi:hypothetical protein
MVSMEMQQFGVPYNLPSYGLFEPGVFNAEYTGNSSGCTGANSKGRKRGRAALASCLDKGPMDGNL